MIFRSSHLRPRSAAPAQQASEKPVEQQETGVPSRPKHDRRWMTTAEWKALLRAARAAGKRETALLMLLYDACLRANEVGKLTLEHCRELQPDRLFYTPRSKKGRAGWFELDPATVKALLEWIDERYPDKAGRRKEWPLFTTRRYREGGVRAISRHSVYHVVAALGAAAGVERKIAHPHAIRHGFIMHALEWARKNNLTREQIEPGLAARVGHKSFATLWDNYVSETAGIKKVMREMVSEMMKDE